METTNNDQPTKANTPKNRGKEINEDIDMVPLYRKKRVMIPFFLLIIAITVGVWYWYSDMLHYVSTDDAYVDANRISISAKVLGRITDLAVDEGDAVTQNQVVIHLDDTDLQAQLALAKASLTFAQEKIPLAQVNLNRARDDFQRADFQYKKAVITKEQYVHAQKTMDAARAEYGIAVAQIAVSRSQVAVIEAQLQNMQISIPFDGVVAKRWVMAGEVVQPGQPIFSIYDLNHVWVTANLEETKLEHVKKGDHVDIHIDTYPDHEFSGTVHDIGNYTASEFSLIPPNNASGNFTKVTQRVPITIYLADFKAQDQKTFPLRPGMSSEIRIKIK